MHPWGGGGGAKEAFGGGSSALKKGRHRPHRTVPNPQKNTGLPQKCSALGAPHIPNRQRRRHTPQPPLPPPGGAPVRHPGVPLARPREGGVSGSGGPESPGARRPAPPKGLKGQGPQAPSGTAPRAAPNSGNMGHGSLGLSASRGVRGGGVQEGDQRPRIQCKHKGTVDPPPPCDIPSGCCFFTGPWTVTRSALRMLRRVAAFCRLPFLPPTHPQSKGLLEASRSGPVQHVRPPAGGGGGSGLLHRNQLPPPLPPRSSVLSVQCAGSCCVVVRLSECSIAGVRGKDPSSLLHCTRSGGVGGGGGQVTSTTCAFPGPPACNTLGMPRPTHLWPFYKQHYTSTPREVVGGGGGH